MIGFPFATYTPETSLGLGAGGVMSFHPGKNPMDSVSSNSSMLSLFVFYTLKKQSQVEAFFSTYWKENKHFIEGEMGFYRYVYPYFGRGNNLSKENREWYEAQSGRFWATYQRKVASHWYAGPRYWVEKNTIIDTDSGGILQTTMPSGINGGWLQGVGFKTSYDSRTDTYFPEKGYYGSLVAMYFPSWLGSKYSFGQCGIDLRMYHHARHKVVFATNLVVKMTFGDVPFYFLPSYGSKNYLRGLTEGRGRNRYLWMLQQEIRYPIPAKKKFWKRFILNTSFATGRTANDARGFFAHRNNAWTATIGGRFRLFNDNNLSLRLDFGFTKGANGTYAVFNEAF